MAITVNPAPNNSSVQLTSSWTYTYASMNGSGGYVYGLSTGPNATSLKRTFDLSSIPSDAIIKSAILTWTYSKSDSGTSGVFAGSTGANYCDISITSNDDFSVKASKKTGDFSSYVVPGAVNTFAFYYKPSANSTLTTSVQASQIKCTSVLTCSNIALEVVYEHNGSIIYHAESGKLVGYKLFHAENGVLVPYQIKLAGNGNLVTYG